MIFVYLPIHILQFALLLMILPDFLVRIVLIIRLNIIKQCEILGKFIRWYLMTSSLDSERGLGIDLVSTYIDLLLLGKNNFFKMGHATYKNGNNSIE